MLDLFERFFLFSGKVLKWCFILLGLYIAYHLVPVVAALAFLAFIFGGIIYWAYRLLKFIYDLLKKVVLT